MGQWQKRCLRVWGVRQIGPPRIPGPIPKRNLTCTDSVIVTGWGTNLAYVCGLHWVKLPDPLSCPCQVKKDQGIVPIA